MRCGVFEFVSGQDLLGEVGKGCADLRFARGLGGSPGRCLGPPSSLLGFDLDLNLGSFGVGLGASLGCRLLAIGSGRSGLGLAGGRASSGCGCLIIFVIVGVGIGAVAAFLVEIVAGLTAFGYFRIVAVISGAFLIFTLFAIIFSEGTER